MSGVSFALREDASTIFMLQDAGKYYNDYCQITVFGRKLINPKLFQLILGMVLSDATMYRVSRAYARSS